MHTLLFFGLKFKIQNYYPLKFKIITQFHILNGATFTQQYLSPVGCQRAGRVKTNNNTYRS